MSKLEKEFNNSLKRQFYEGKRAGYDRVIDYLINLENNLKGSVNESVRDCGEFVVKPISLIIKEFKKEVNEEEVGACK